MRYFIIFIAFTTLLLSSEKKNIEKMVKELENIEKRSFDTSNNPFTTNESKKINSQPKKEKREDIAIQGILNSNVLINGVWHKEGDFIKDKKIVYIGDKGIIVSNKNGDRRTIKLAQKNNKKGFQLEKSQ